VSHRLNLPASSRLQLDRSGDSELVHRRGRVGRRFGQAGPRPPDPAILPLRGKVLNASRRTNQKLLANKELQDIVSALGCGMGDSIELGKLRYGKIFLLMDADADGHHIATLCSRSSSAT